MRAIRIIGVMVVLLQACAVTGRAGEILLQGDDPLVVDAVNPDRVSMAESKEAAGGLDADLPGDRSYYRLSVTSVGKRFYQTPDAISLFVDTTGVHGALQIEIGVYRGQYGSRNGVVRWDGKPLMTIDAYGAGNLRVETLQHTLTPGPGLHELTIADQPGQGAYITIDAIRLAADGDLALVTRDGVAINTETPALSPDRAAALALQLEKLSNLAVFTGDTVWHASENFPVPTYSARAAFDGNPEDGNYWAGGSPAPHAIEVRYPQPITFDTNRIRWMGANRAVVYGLEAWDGEHWNLVYDEPHNLREQPIYQFAPVTSDRIRFTMLRLTGQQRVLMKSFELYHRGSAQP